MKKILLGGSIAAILLLVNIAFASSFSTAAEKWFEKNCVTGNNAPKGIEAGVCDLRARILALEATDPVPGPQGEPGVPGPVGPSLKVFDAGGNDFGFLIDGTGYHTSITIFSEQYNQIFQTDLFTGRIARPGVAQMYFESTDCTGSILVEHKGSQSRQIPIFIQDNNTNDGSRYLAINSYPLKFVNSIFQLGAVPACRQVLGGPLQIDDVAEVVKSDIPDFVAPLSIQVE